MRYKCETYWQAGEVRQDEGGDVPGAGRPVVRGESTVACVAVPARPEIDTCEKSESEKLKSKCK